MFWGLANSIFHFFINSRAKKLKTIFSESDGKSWKLFKCKDAQSKHFSKQFWSYFEVKNNSSESLKMVFSLFFADFWLTKLKPFSEKPMQSTQNSKTVFLENQKTQDKNLKILRTKRTFKMRCKALLFILKGFSSK